MHGGGSGENAAKGAGGSPSGGSGGSGAVVAPGFSPSGSPSGGPAAAAAAAAAAAGSPSSVVGANHSLAIRQEIQRFESVHPSIYAIYDLIELIPDPLLAQQVREHVVCIEDSFVNSQEWTLSRGVPDLRLGIVGSLSSGKSALVHRYLTGSYMQEESPEGGRFKKEIVVDGQSFLLLIRDEGGPPEAQFTSWVDAVIFVFSLENEASFNAVYNYYAKMSQLRRDMRDVPVILVGTQDAIAEGRPRVVDDSRARKLAAELRPRCAYYETCATYGLNVERVFQDACHKITSASAPYVRPVTPNTAGQSHLAASASSGGGGTRSLGGSFLSSPTTTGNGFVQSVTSSPLQQQASPLGGGGGANIGSSSAYKESRSTSSYDFSRISTSSVSVPAAALVDRDQAKFAVPLDKAAAGGDSNKENSAAAVTTPTSTPTSARKSRRRSNLFTPSKKASESSSDHHRHSASSHHGGGMVIPEASAAGSAQPQLGSGRSIPVRQGYLYKKSSKSFSKEWKKKYVTLCDDGRMTYHPSLHDYMENIHGKEIPLQYVTVKVPGQKPRGSRSIPGGGGAGNNNSEHVPSGLGDKGGGGGGKGEKVLLTGYEPLRDPSGGEDASGGPPYDGAVNGGPSSNGAPPASAALDKLTDTPNVKKRHRRIKSNGVKAGQDCEDPDVFEFHIVSLDNKQWHFDAASAEERDEWVAAIEQQILSSLQGNESNKAKGQAASAVDLQTMKTIKNDIPGNLKCVDCDAPNPDWASLNLGVLMCIECSGIHRQLGSHISRVRSLDLDEWPPGHLSVMVALGNRLANTVWESSSPSNRGQQRRKPAPNSSPEEKERYIKAKYVSKDFLSPWPSGASKSSTLVDAICRSDVRAVLLVLAHSPAAEEVSAPVSPRDNRTPLHLAASRGNLAITQLLIWANANVKAVDHEGRTCVSYARGSGCQEVVDLLLSNGCPDIALSGTLPRKKGTGVGGGGGPPSARKADVFDKIASSVL